MSGLSSSFAHDLPAHDDAAAEARYMRLKKIIFVQSVAIIALAVVLALILPLTRPVYTYYALQSDQKTLQMIGLDTPNLTDRAIISWATVGVTEIMTVGFGDINKKILLQKKRFTSKGWDGYATAFDRIGIDQLFKERQLVLTTVPSGTPVIIGQGVNPDGVYQWNLQMPVIMTYATNNNVTRQQNHLIGLSLVQVPADEDVFGIAIDKWDVVD